MNNVPEGVGGAFWIGCTAVVLFGCCAIGLGVALPDKYAGAGFLGVVIIGICVFLVMNRFGRK